MSKPYPSYKNSGVEWLGEVPAHWRLSKLKNFTRFSGGGTPSRENLTYWNGTIPWVSPKDMKTEEISDAEEHITEAGLRGSSTNLVAVDHVLMVVRSGILKHTIPVAINTKPVALNQDMKALSFPLGECHPRFLLRWVQGLNDLLLLAWAKQGATVESIEHNYLSDTIVPLPPIEEQRAINAFLDHETAKIDALVEEQRRLIALLKEKRQAVISHAVTKGLNPNAPMKDSGIEWLGEVPEHWEVISIKWLSQVKRGASPRPIDDPKYFDDDGEYAWVRIADVSACDGTLTATTQKLSDLGSSLSVKIKPGELFISIAGTVGKPCLSAIKACIHDGFVYFPTLKIDPQFLYRVFESGSCYGGLGKMGTQLNLNTDTIGSIRVALPPLDELKRLLDFLNYELAKLDKLTAEAMATVALLQERRTALISAAVTGKIDVRPSAQVIIFPVDRARVRGLVATEIIERMGSHNTFGRVKLQKLAYLAEAHVGVSELGGNYLRMAAGPLDSDMVNEMEREASLICGVLIEQPGGARTAVAYRTTGRKGRHSAELSKFLGPERSGKLNRLISDLREKSTRSTEAIATLYAVWNNALIDGKTPSDAGIVYDFLNDWHPEKRDKFKNLGELHTWLDWMRHHGLVPTGNGPKVHPSQLLI